MNAVGVALYPANCTDPSTGSVFACFTSSGNSSGDVAGYALAPSEFTVFQTIAAQSAAAAPAFDYDAAAGYFGFAFVTVLACWLLGYAVGLIMRTVREA